MQIRVAPQQRGRSRRTRDLSHVFVSYCTLLVYSSTRAEPTTPHRLTDFDDQHAIMTCFRTMECMSFEGRDETASRLWSDPPQTSFLGA